MSIQSLEGASQSYFDDMLQSEITIMTSAIPADTSGGGIRMNSVLKDGGNLFSGAAFIGFSSGEWQSDNVDDSLRAAPNSIRTANGIKHIQMFTGSLGGPIKKDKLWFIVTARHQSSDETVANVPVQITTPQGDVLNSYLDTYVRGPSLRMTWQAAEKHKLGELRAAVVEAEGTHVRRRAGPANRPVPRPAQSAPHRRQHQVPRPRSRTSCSSRGATRGRCSIGTAVPTSASSSRVERRSGTHTRRRSRTSG